METFKTGLSEKYRLAFTRFESAIAEVDKSIEAL